MLLIVSASSRACGGELVEAPRRRLPLPARCQRLPEQEPGRVKNTTLFEPLKTLAQLRVCLDSLAHEPALPPIASEFVHAVGLWLNQSGA